MATVKVEIIDRKVAVSSRFEYKDALSPLWGAEWDPRRLVWKFPNTPWSVAHLMATLEEKTHSIGDKLAVDPLVTNTELQAVSIENQTKEILARSSSPIKVAGSRFTPWMHQYIGTRLVVALEAVYLAWEMGTGKTKALIDAILDLAHVAATGDPGFFPALLICPATVVEVWDREVPKHADCEYAISASRNKQVKKRVADAEAAWKNGERHKLPTFIVTNYESFMLDGSPFLEWAAEKWWGLLGLDEAHRLANPGAKTTRAITNKIAPKARKRVCLSGTPMRNDPLDLFSQCRILDPGIFGTTKTKFLDRYAILDFFGAVVGINHKEELADRFSLVAHRVDKRKVLDLPPVVVTSRRFTLSDSAQAIYDELEKEMTVKVGSGEITAANAIVVLLRLQQITSGYAPVEEEDKATKFVEIDSGKSELLAEMLLGMPDSEPAVVFCRFRRDLDEARRVAGSLGRGYMEVSGRGNELRAWQDATGGEVIGVQIQSGGFGIDLTRAATAFFYSVGFSLADYQQATARIDRPGQTRNTTIVNFIAKGTIDEAVFGAIDSKANVIEKVLDRLRGIA